MLNINNVTMRFGGVVAVNDFEAHVNKGEIVGLIGPNGAGKTTVFNMVTGVYPPSSGTIQLGVKEELINITGMRPDKIAKLGVCRTFQNIRLFKDLSVEDNVFIGNHLRLKQGMLSSIRRTPAEGES